MYPIIPSLIHTWEFKKPMTAYCENSQLWNTALPFIYSYIDNAWVLLLLLLFLTRNFANYSITHSFIHSGWRQTCESVILVFPDVCACVIFFLYQSRWKKLLNYCFSDNNREKCCYCDCCCCCCYCDSFLTTMDLQTSSFAFIATCFHSCCNCNLVVLVGFVVVVT